MILTTPATAHLDLDVASLQPHPETGDHRFPDGEVYVQVPDIDADRVTVVHSGQPDPNTGLMWLYGALAALRERGIARDVILTYPPYGRQDTTFFDGTLNYARELLRTLVQDHGAGTVHVVEPHFAHRDWLGDMPVEVLHAFDRIDDAVMMDDYMVVGPDLGAVERFRVFGEDADRATPADGASSGIEGFEKERHGGDVSITGDLDVAGENVLVFDDMIATGGTMAAAYDELVDQGADRIEAAAVHGVLQEGVDRVASTYDALHLTNTIDRDAATVGIEPLLRDRVNL
ncbi:MAG: ribose-phosphate diphosphokinase [Candidatus Nanohaloarchaea archaeon]